MKNIKKLTNYKLKILALTLIIPCVIAACLSGCNLASNPVTKNGFYLDTVISITLYDSKASEHIDGCMDIAKKYDETLNNKNSESEISKINNANSEFVVVSQDTIDIITQGIKYGELSNDTFDITLGNLTALWDFKNRTSAPSDAEITNLLGFNYKDIEINGNQVRLTNSKNNIDVGGIAKGFIAEKMKAYLLSEGVNKGLINLGGNIVTLDPKSSTESYNIGIQKPFSESGEAIIGIKTANKSVVTSGDYQRYFQENGKIYHHILNTSTGYPVDNDLDSATIICNNSTDGDALSTITFAYGLEKGLAFIESLPDTDAILITKDGNIHMTSGITEDMIIRPTQNQ